MYFSQTAKAQRSEGEWVELWKRCTSEYCCKDEDGRGVGRWEKDETCNHNGEATGESTISSRMIANRRHEVLFG